MLTYMPFSLSSLCMGAAMLGALAPCSSVFAAEFVDNGQVTYQRFVSEGGFFSCVFFGEGTGMPGTVKPDGTYANRVSAFSDAQIEGIMRAVNTLEKTFVFATKADGKPVRPAQLTFAIATALPYGVAAAADPITSFTYNGMTPPRTTWLESDFGGRVTGKQATVNNLESVLKYGGNVFYSPITEANPQYWIQSSPGKGDGYVVFNYNQFKADGSSISSLMPSIESVALHELGHTMGFMHNANSAMGALIEKDADGTYWFVGETAMQYNGGQRVKMSESGMDHSNAMYGNEEFAALMNQYPRIKGQTTFSDLDLAMFQDMGWTIRDSAWTNPLGVPEPCSAVLLAAGSLCVVWRRRR